MRGDATGSGVLDNDDGRLFELCGGAPGGVAIKVIDVRHLDSVELLRRQKAGRRTRRIEQVDGGFLVGVLAVAEVGGFFQTDGQLLGEVEVRVERLCSRSSCESLRTSGPEIGRDRRVVAGDVLEGFSREAAPVI